jgi:hypothetical protein
MLLLLLVVGIFIISFGIVWVRHQIIGEKVTNRSRNSQNTLPNGSNSVYRQDKNSRTRFNEKARKCI